MKYTVVLDTNALRGSSWFETASTETKRLVAEMPPELDVRVVVPQVVRDERLYQITESALEALRRAAPLVQLSGARLPSEETVAAGAKQRLDEQLEGLGIEVLPLDYVAVDLAGIVADSVSRTAPFTNGCGSPAPC